MVGLNEVVAAYWDDLFPSPGSFIRVGQRGQAPSRELVIEYRMMHFSLRGGPEAVARLAAETIPAGRVGEPEEMAAAAVFLCSTRAAFITGEAVRVDGGAARAV